MKKFTMFITGVWEDLTVETYANNILRLIAWFLTIKILAECFKHLQTLVSDCSELYLS